MSWVFHGSARSCTEYWYFKNIGDNQRVYLSHKSEEKGRLLWLISKMVPFSWQLFSRVFDVSSARLLLFCLKFEDLKVLIFEWTS